MGEFLCGITATASVFAERALGFQGKNFYVRVFIGLSVSMATAGVLHSSIFAGSRLFSAGVKFNHMPKVIGGIHKEYKTPVPSIFLLCLMSCIYCFTPLVNDEAIDFLVNATCFIYFLAIAICIILLVQWRLNGRPNVGSVLDKIPVNVTYNEASNELNDAMNLTLNTQLESTRITPENQELEESPLKGQQTISYKQEKTLDEMFILPIWVHLAYALLSLAISAYNVYAEWSSTLIGISIILIGMPVYYVFVFKPEPLLEYLGCEVEEEDAE